MESITLGVQATILIGWVSLAVLAGVARRSGALNRAGDGRGNGGDAVAVASIRRQGCRSTPGPPEEGRPSRRTRGRSAPRRSTSVRKEWPVFENTTGRSKGRRGGGRPVLRWRPGASPGPRAGPCAIGLRSISHHGRNSHGPSAARTKCRSGAGGWLRASSAILFRGTTVSLRLATLR
jgi:hypothetical protein